MAAVKADSSWRVIVGMFVSADGCGDPSVKLSGAVATSSLVSRNIVDRFSGDGYALPVRPHVSMSPGDFRHKDLTPMKLKYSSKYPRWVAVAALAITGVACLSPVRADAPAASAEVVKLQGRRDPRFHGRQV